MLLGLWGPQAMSLSLGRVVVQSALGEPLRADIDFLELSPEEASTLSTAIASPEAFRAAGLSYVPAVSDLQASLQKRADGRLFVRLSSSSPITESFFDLLLEANWASGRLLRDYTLLFAPAKAGVTRIDEAVNARVRQVQGGKLKVQAGDTASHIAAALKPANVSLDQMLVALLRANPGVFQGDNVNRIQAGAVLTIPSAAQASETERPEATRVIAAQSRDFNDFRRKFAGVAPEARPEGASRQASGTVQAKVEDKQAPASADKLTLAKSSVQDAMSEEQLAKQRSTREAAARADEIARNINELNRLGASTQAAAVSAPAPAASAPTTPAIVSPVPASAPASAPKPPASAMAPAKPAGRIERLVDHPLVSWGAAALITALASVLAYRIGRRRRDGDQPPEEATPSQTLNAFLVSNSAADTLAAQEPDMQETQFVPSRSRQPEPEPEPAPVDDQPEPLPQALPSAVAADLEIDFPLDEPPDGAEPLPQPIPDDLDLQFDTPEPEPEPEPEDEAEASPAAPPEPLPLDLGSLSLDLGEEFQDSKAALTDLSEDPLETKLDLAEEFRAIGDEDGARALIEEVIEAATGDMKARAERALGKLK
jgi:FimV-like protein